ncbi:MAG: hypothetical protein COA77_03420 [Thaumarchaeota archaeon]|nr:MAG: hypothetical protein COA77_03420 [Nitrososphaerota archaeon]
MDHYIEKVKKFNQKDNYHLDIETGKLLIKYCLTSKQKIFYVIGTGLGEDIEIVKSFKNVKIIGIEPRITFQEFAEKKYSKFGFKLIKQDLGEFTSSYSHKIYGIFLFIHSLNHIPHAQIKSLEKIMKKDSYILVINPNPLIEQIKGKTDKTAFHYLNSKKISNLLKSEIIFDFFYNPKPVRGQRIPIREAILLKK